MNTDHTAPTSTMESPQSGTRERQPETGPQSSAPASPGRSRALTYVVVLVLALAACAGSYCYYTRFIEPYESTDNAFIEGNVIPVASQVPGRVAELQVIDNQVVKAGDVLLKIDARDYETGVAQAKADLTAARSRLEQAKAQVKASQAKIAQTRAAVLAAEAESQRAADDLKRYDAVESRAVSKSAHDLAQSQSRAASAHLEAARSLVNAAEAEAALSEASVAAANAGIEQAQAKLQQAELNLSYTTVVASEEGRVTRRVVEKGAYIQPGQALMAVVPRRCWIIANFKETQLTFMRPGQPVEIEVDAYPQIKFKGHIDSIQTGSGARFSMFPPENATGNYVKVVQRVPVKIVLDEVPGNDLTLGPGMSVTPRVRVK